MPLKTYVCIDVIILRAYMWNWMANLCLQCLEVLLRNFTKLNNWQQQVQMLLQYKCYYSYCIDMSIYRHTYVHTCMYMHHIHLVYINANRYMYISVSESLSTSLDSILDFLWITSTPWFRFNEVFVNGWFWFSGIYGLIG